MCFNAGAQLTASGGLTYEWRNYNNTYTSTEQSPVVNPQEDDGYIVSIFDFNGCAKKDTINIRVIPE